MSSSHPAIPLTTTTNTVFLEGLKDPKNHIVWQQFVDRYQPLVIRFARRLGLKEDHAQDAAQQAMIEFSRAYHAGKYQRDKGRLRIWLFGIARNQIKNFQRNQAGREVQIVDETSGTGFFASQDNEDQQQRIWEEEWRDGVLRQCLDEVRNVFDEKTVRAFELFAWKGLPAKHVAGQLGMTEGAIFLAKHRILKKIREMLPQMEEVW